VCFSFAQARYGSIVKYQWFGDGYMMIGFSEGYVVVISTHMKEIVEELFSGKFHKVRLCFCFHSSGYLRLSPDCDAVLSSLGSY
jgi:hypothetical protein